MEASPRREGVQDNAVAPKLKPSPLGKRLDDNASHSYDMSGPDEEQGTGFPPKVRSQHVHRPQHRQPDSATRTVARAASKPPVAPLCSALPAHAATTGLARSPHSPPTRGRDGFATSATWTCCCATWSACWLRGPWYVDLENDVSHNILLRFSRSTQAALDRHSPLVCARTKGK